MAKRLKIPKIAKETIISEKPAFVTPQQAAGQLDCSEAVIRRMVRRGELQGAKIGGRFKIIQTSIDAVLYRVLGRLSTTQPSTENGEQSRSLAASQG